MSVGGVQPGVSSPIEVIRHALVQMPTARLMFVPPDQRRKPEAVVVAKLRHFGVESSNHGWASGTFVLAHGEDGALQVNPFWKGRVPSEGHPALAVAEGLRAAVSKFGDRPRKLREQLVLAGVVHDLTWQEGTKTRSFLLHENLRAKLAVLMPKFQERMQRFGLRLEIRENTSFGLTFKEIVVLKGNTEFGVVRSSQKNRLGELILGSSRTDNYIGCKIKSVQMIGEDVIPALHYMVMLAGDEINFDNPLLQSLKDAGYFAKPEIEV